MRKFSIQEIRHAVQQQKQLRKEAGYEPIRYVFCRWLGEATTKDHACGGCGKGIRTVWQCDLYGETLPFYAPPDGFRSCRKCDDYVAEKE